MIKLRKILYRKWIQLLAPLFASVTFSCVYGPGPGGLVIDELTIKGKVTDSVTHAGVNDIVVALIVKDVNGENVVNTVLTTNGDYFLYANPNDYVSPVTLTVITTDVDGVNNGGEYQSASASADVDLTLDSHSVVLDVPIVKL